MGPGDVLLAQLLLDACAEALRTLCVPIYWAACLNSVRKEGSTGSEPLTERELSIIAPPQRLNLVQHTFDPWRFELRLEYPLSSLPLLLFAFQSGVAIGLIRCEILEQSHHIPNYLRSSKCD